MTKGQKNPIKSAQLWISTPIFSGFWNTTPSPAKWHMILKVLTENKLFYFSKKALRVDTVRNK